MRALLSLIVVFGSLAAHAQSDGIILDRLRAGDEVMTSGGSIGTVNGVFGDRDISVRIGYSNYTFSRDQVAGGGCSSGACTGDQVYTSGGSVGKVVGIFPNGDTGLLIGYSGYRMTRANVAIKGCFRHICSDDNVTTRGGSSGVVAGVFPSGEFSVLIGYTYYKLSADNLASERPPRPPRPDSSTNRMPVTGEKVFTTGGSEGVIVGVFNRDEFSVRIGYTNYTLKRSVLAVEGCSRRLCSGDKVITRGGSEGEVVAFFIDGDASVRIGYTLYKMIPDDLAQTR